MSKSRRPAKRPAPPPPPASRLPNLALVVILLAAGLVVANNSGLLPERWTRHLLVGQHRPACSSERGRIRAVEPPPAARRQQPANSPQPVAKPAAPTLPALPRDLPVIQPQPQPPAGQAVEVEAPPTPAPEPRPVAPAPRPTAKPAPPPRPASAPREPRPSGLLTPDERRERLVDRTLPSGFTPEWRGGPAKLGLAANEIVQGRPVQRIALTLDGCYEDELIPATLQILAEHRVRATFFLTGIFARRFPSAVRRIAAAGHEIANHSATHPYLTKLSRDRALAEVEEAEKLLLPLARDAYRPYLRPPFGDRDTAVCRMLLQHGFLPVYWTIDTLDWQQGATPESVLARVARKGLEPGSILLCHAGSAATQRALPELLGKARAAGLEPGTLSGVLGE
ncbi:MAG: polysaccharide deacetylase family protein [Fimbriimonadaceae bacterium]|nr:polysaccharide deacetylase family protein [Fimbriimonadaceae bacterium]